MKNLQIPSAHNSLRSSSPPVQIMSPPAARYLTHKPVVQCTKKRLGFYTFVKNWVSHKHGLVRDNRSSLDSDLDIFLKYKMGDISKGVSRAGISKKSMGARHRVGIGLSYRPAGLLRLSELMPWNLFMGSIKRLKIRAQHTLSLVRWVTTRTVSWWRVCLLPLLMGSSLVLTYLKNAKRATYAKEGSIHPGPTKNKKG